MTKANIIWQPHEGSQTAFMAVPTFEVLYEGTRGPGKTDALLMDFLQHTGQGFGPAWKGILFRETFPQLSDVIAKSNKWFRQIYPKAKWNASDHRWIFPDGEELLLRHMRRPDDYWDYHGHEYPWVGWEELTNWATRDCYESMKACCRSSFPGVTLKDEDGYDILDGETGKTIIVKQMPRKYRATCNPYGVGHSWVKARFISPAPRGVVIKDTDGRERLCIHGSIYENRHLLDNDPDYLLNLEGITDPNKRAAWLKGSWDIVAGGMLDDVWDRRINVVAPFKIPKSWTIDRSFDWGSSRPFSTGWWAESDGTDVTLADGTKRSTCRGDVYRMQEWYGSARDRDGEVIPNEGLKMLAKDIAKGIKERDEIIQAVTGIKVQPGPADSSIYDVENGNCIADDMAAEGVEWTKAEKGPGSRKQGWEKVRVLLSSAASKDEPGLYVFDRCRDFIRTVPVLPRSSKDPDDVDTDVEDHAGDETRYRIFKRKDYVTKVKLQGA